MENSEYIFDFERLEVYKMALKFIAEVFKIYQKLPRGFQFTIGEQFIRASLSIANNIAEGSGKNSGAGKIQFYSYSLNSARECIPMITLLSNEKKITLGEYDYLRTNCVSICKMLGKLIGTLK